MQHHLSFSCLAVVPCFAVLYCLLLLLLCMWSVYILNHCPSCSNVAGLGKNHFRVPIALCTCYHPIHPSSLHSSRVHYTASTSLASPGSSKHAHPEFTSAKLSDSFNCFHDFMIHSSRRQAMPRHTVSRSLRFLVKLIHICFILQVTMFTCSHFQSCFTGPYFKDPHNKTPSAPNLPA